LIALRYSNIRSQFKHDTKNERTIIDYQSQRKKIYTSLSIAYAIQFSFEKINKLLDQNNTNVEKGDFSLMKEIHIYLCGGKAMYSDWHNEEFNKLIQACGGHGLLQSAGFMKVFDGNMSNSILEGDNVVMLLQISRELLRVQE